MFQIGLIGAGLWGPNVARSFEETGAAEIRWICDLDQERRSTLPARVPPLRRTADVARLLADPLVDAVAIVTPADSHFQLARAALLAGKHVLVEKPFTTNSADAIELIDLADRLDRVLFVGHVFEYNSTIVAVKELLRSGTLGDPRYIRCERTNFGPVRDDVNALWDLGAHDISILCLLMGAPPLAVTAVGECHLKPGIEDVVSASFTFPGDIKADIHVSWLNPIKVRQMTLVGTAKTVLWDDLDVGAPIQVFEGVEGVHRFAVARNVPLRAQASHFLRCLQSPDASYSDGRNGLRVVQALEAATASLRAGGREVAIDSSSVPRPLARLAPREAAD
jgi:predicted dehydrogenase